MQKAHKKPVKTGLRALKTLVEMRGLRAIDQRTLAGRALVEWKEALVNALGGPDQISPQRAALIDLIVRTRLYVDCVDRFLLSQESIVDKRKRSVLPAVRERQTLCDSLARLLGQLGLSRVERDGGAIPAEWITKVRPVEEPEAQQNAAAPEPGIDRDHEKSGGQE